MISLLSATSFFVAAHLLLSRTAARQGLVGRVGELGYLGIYSLLAFAGMAWMVVAYTQRPQILLWAAPYWAYYLPLLLMPFALYLIVGGYMVRNPMSLGQQGAFGEAGLPDVLRITRHPAMWGIAIWASSHLVVKGDLGSLVMFGGLLVLALGGAAHIDQRRRLAFPEQFARFAARTSFLPFAALAAGWTGGRSRTPDWRPVAAALTAYAALLLLHGKVIGAAPWPA